MLLAVARLAHPFKQVCRSVVIEMAAAASASPLAAAACASDRLIVAFAAKAKLGGKTTSRIHSTKCMTPAEQTLCAKAAGEEPK